MKKIYLLIVLFVSIVCNATNLDTKIKTEARKHDYNTFFAIKNNSTFDVYYKDDYGITNKKFSVTPEKLLSIDTTYLASYKHEYNTFFIEYVKGEEYSIFYKDDYGVIKLVYNSNKIGKTEGFKDGYNDGTKTNEESEGEDAEEKGGGAKFFLFICIAFFVWLLFFD